MHGRPITPGLFQCRLCRHSLPIRQFHSSYIKPEEQPNPPSRRVATRTTAYKSLENLARRVPLPSSRSPQANKSSPTSPPTQSSNNGPPKVLYRRVGQPQRPTPSTGPTATPRGPPGRVREGAKNARRPNTRTSNRRRESGGPATSPSDAYKEAILPVEATNYSRLSEAQGDSFASIEELQNYSQVLDLLDSYKDHQERARRLEEYRAAPNKSGGMTATELKKAEARVKEDEERFNSLIAEAMQHVIDTDEKYLPRHEPPADSPVTQPKGAVGGIPIGTAGMGALVEDSLRYLSDRSANKWQDPKALAARLANGDFVKFRDLNERNDVVRLAEAFEWEDGQDVNKQNVGFEPLTDDAKKLLVQTLVQGRYADPNDKNLKGNMLKSVARLTGGNFTYLAAAKQTLLSTIQELMPQERSGTAAGRQKKQAA